MPIAGLVKRQTYRDSVALMVLSTALAERDGVLQASAMMATPANLEILQATGLCAEAFAEAGPNDLCVAVEARDAEAVAAALAQAEALLNASPAARQSGFSGDRPAGVAWRPRTLQSAARARPDANIAVISVPGEHATLEARQALLAGLHVFLFSDNVPLADEIELKRLATARGLLLMGPDCGTASIGGAPLGFANAVRRGPIGVVGSSGTGLQEVTSLIHRLGGGVSHALGTGSRDLYEEVGGATFLAAVDALAADPETQVLVAVAKPGAPGVQARVLERLAASGKPTVVYFLGGARVGDHPGILEAHDLEHAARCAVALADGEQPPAVAPSDEVEAWARQIVAGLSPGQVAVRGLFAGGTLAQELSAAVVGGLQGAGVHRVDDVADDASTGGAPGEVLRVGPHRVLDLGDDAYTQGRPHPLIDPRLRNAELVAQAATGEVALFAIDVILGTGSHPDPAEALRPAINSAREAAQARGARLEILASLCGTDQDAQGYERQRAGLEAAGVRVARSSSMAAAVAARVAALLAEGSR
ncbi:MAG: acyl-CoA synthetase FdrA [Chloroflexota bacterium]